MENNLEQQIMVCLVYRGKVVSSDRVEQPNIE